MADYNLIKFENVLHYEERLVHDTFSNIKVPRPDTVYEGLTLFYKKVVLINIFDQFEASCS